MEANLIVTPGSKMNIPNIFVKYFVMFFFFLYIYMLGSTGQASLCLKSNYTLLLS